MDECTKVVLGLQGYEVLAVYQVSDREEEIEVCLPASSTCPECGALTSVVHQQARKVSRVLWSFVNGRRLSLLLHRRRLRCKACGKVFSQAPPGVARRQRVGVMAQVSIIDSLAEQSFAALRRTCRVSYGQARRILLRLPVPWCNWDYLLGDQKAIALGIDEHSFRGNNLLITITCLTTHRLIAILQDDRQVTLRDWLKGLPDEIRQRVVAVCTDLKASYLKVVRKILPHAAVVIDRFHVIQDANRRLDETRRLEQGELKRIIQRWPLVKGEERLTAKQRQYLDVLKGQFPSLAEQHWLKEELRQLYRCTDLRKAQEHWQRLLFNGETSDDASTVLWMRSLRNWGKEIMAYFQFPITNGYTEGCHTKVKLLKRMSYGFRNVQVYIRKMLLGFQPHTYNGLVSHLLT
jgi:transposase